MNEMVWMVVSDAKGGRLLRGNVTEQGRIHLEEVDRVNSVQDVERGRASSPPGRKDFRVGAKRESEEHLRRVANDLMHWLEHQAAKWRISQVTLFAPPRLVSVLREVRSLSLSGRVNIQARDLAQLKIAALARHPSVREMVLGRPAPALI